MENPTMDISENPKENGLTNLQDRNFQESALEAIHRQLRYFNGVKTAQLSRYLERDKRAIVSPRITILNGWADTFAVRPSEQLFPQVLKQHTDLLSRSGGYWLQLGGVGIVINPGQWFLERLHTAGLHVWDIDHVIVTDGCETASSDLERLWTFNAEINAYLKEWGLDPHIISYWLHPQCFERSNAKMRPRFRQEQATIHRLETFQDMNSFETIALTEIVKMDYQASPLPLSPLSLRLSSDSSFTIGFTSGAPYTQHLGEFLSPCTGLILGMGPSSFEEITSLSLSPNALGYGGTHQILKQAHNAQFAIIAEQAATDGDLRIETLKQLRNEIGVPTLTILPAEEGSTFYLPSLHMTAPGLDSPTPIRSVRALRTKGHCSRLMFLDETSVL